MRVLDSDLGKAKVQIDLEGKQCLGGGRGAWRGLFATRELLSGHWAVRAGWEFRSRGT